MVKFFIKQAKKRKEIIKFFIAGGAATVVDMFFVFLFFDVLEMKIAWAASWAFLITFFVSFFLQKFWTFRDNDRSRMKQQMFSYFLTGLFGLAVNAVGMHFLVEVWEIWYLFSLTLIIGGLAVFNFLVYKFIIFKKQHKDLAKDVLLEDKEEKNVKLLIATGIYPPEGGGPATYSKALKKELTKAGYEVKVVTYGNPNLQEKDVYVVNRKKNVIFRYFDYFYSVWKLALWADLVYVQGPMSEGLPSYLACKFRRKKYLLKIVGDYAWEQSNRFGVTDLLDDFQTKKYVWQVELMRKLQKLVARNAALIITPSEYLKRIVSFWGIEDEKIKVIYNAISSKQVEKIEKPEGEKWLVTNARLVPWKGIDTLIDLMPSIWHFDDDIKLKIISDGPMRPQLEKKIKSLKPHKQEDVSLLGYMPNEKALGYMQAADLFILNSGYEGLAHVILECFKLGTPVLASRAGGNPELVIPGQSGDLFDYNDSRVIENKILNFFESGDGQNDWLLTSEGKEFLAQFDFAVMLKKIKQVIEDLCES
jgi:glycosyltransferase involved in cell wall biosynthesis/putative flippase GtrA